MFDIISIGDTTIDTIIQFHDANLHCNLKKDECQLCLNYGDKIPVDQMTRLVAGNAANNAVGTSRLGLKAAYCGIVGDDENGEWILQKLHREKVSTIYATQQKRTESNLSTVLSFKGERTILVYHAPRKYSLPKMDGTKWVYYTSVGKNHTLYNKQVVAFAKKDNVKLAYNPGTYQLQTELKEMRLILKNCHIVFVNVQEAEKIVGTKKDMKEYLHSLHALGTKIVVITDGKNGSYVYDGDAYFKMGILAGPNIERTGAGDSYASAFIAALFHEKTIPEAMCWGATNSMSVIGKIGPQAGLLSIEEIQKLHKKIKHIHATTF